MTLNDKVILITGSTTGIGAAAAKRCIEEGAYVMLHGRDEERARLMVDELGNKTHYCIADLADPTECDRLVAVTIKQFGRLDGVVNNAAVMTRSDIDSSDAALFEAIMSVNLRAPLLLSRAAIQHFRQCDKNGVIVNIGSLNAYCGQTDLLLYSMSKGGMMTMTRNLADAWSTHGIRVNQLNVGWTVTENEIALKRREGLPEGWQHHVSKVFAPSGRLLSPEQVAEHIVFWLSDKSAPVSGSIYEVEQYPVIGRNKIAEDQANESK